MGADQHRTKKSEATLVFCALTIAWELQMIVESRVFVMP